MFVGKNEEPRLEVRYRYLPTNRTRTRYVGSSCAQFVTGAVLDFVQLEGRLPASADELFADYDIRQLDDELCPDVVWDQAQRFANSVTYAMLDSYGERKKHHYGLWPAVRL